MKPKRPKTPIRKYDRKTRKYPLVMIYSFLAIDGKSFTTVITNGCRKYSIAKTPESGAGLELNIGISLV